MAKRDEITLTGFRIWFPVGAGIFGAIIAFAMAWAAISGSISSLQTVTAETKTDVKEIRSEVKKLSEDMVELKTLLGVRAQAPKPIITQAPQDKISTIYENPSVQSSNSSQDPSGKDVEAKEVPVPTPTQGVVKTIINPVTQFLK